MISKSTRWMAGFALIASCILLQTSAVAQNGTWTENTAFDGTWSSSANWAGGTIANGADNTADFSTVDVDAAAVVALYPGTGFSRNAVQLDSARTIGTLIFGDSNASSPGGWEIYTNDATNNVLTLAGASPTVTVHPMGPIDTATLGDVSPEIIDDVLFSSVGLAGTSGFTKMGQGTLTLGGLNPNLTGTINVNEGTLRTVAGATFDFEIATTPAVTQFALANGATIEAGTGIGQNAAGGPGITIATGATATLRKLGTGSLFFNNVGGAGATLNFESQGGTSTLDRDWAAGGALAAINLTGLGGAARDFRIRHTNGAFNTESFAATAVNLSSATLFTTNFSGGSTFTFGSLAGDATSTLRGGASGSVSNYQIGDLNANTNFAGNVETGVGGINIFKRGTGVQEFSGTLSYAPTTNAIANRRGGIMRVESGTVKVSGAAAIPVGVDDTGTATNLGLLYTTLDVRAGATFDVSATSTLYSTPSISQVVGTGTIVGNYNHGDGILAPGDTLTGGNTDSRIATAGTLTFANTLSFSGTGQINFDISPSLASGNDRLEVGGANLTGSPTVKIGFLGGASAGEYVLLNSASALAGNTSGWAVQWEGRGAAPSIVQTANQVKLDLNSISTGNLNWRGNVDGVWNAGAATGTANWHNTDTASSDQFFQLDNVAFRDTYDGVNAPTTTATTLNTNVSPSSVVVDSSLNYSISGTGKITGGAGLTKQGSGTLTMTTANDYAGGTTVSGGIIDFGATGTAGLGTITLSGGQIQRESGTTANNIVVTASTTNVFRNKGGDDGAGGRTTTGTPLTGAISGSGTLQFFNDAALADTTPVIEAVDVSGDNSGFTGSVAFTGPSPYAFRFATEQSGGDNVAWDFGSNGTQVGKVIGADATFHFGSLTGGAGSTPGTPTATLRGQYSGGGEGAATYVIGGLNTSTTYDGLIEDGQGVADMTRPGNVTHITKEGTGTLTLTYPNTYTGNTRVDGGVLSISNAYLADTADVLIDAGALLNLNFSGNDTIDALYLDGVPQTPGLYGLGALGSTFFSGTGRLMVTNLGDPLGVTGDYNGDGTVDAADYTVWRDNLNGDASALENRDPNNMGNVNQDDYDSWKANFGAMAGAGAGASTTAAVPEPATWLLACVLMLLPLSGGRRR
jgi:autotransporter-associated beta strand protein